ncbi:MULTISPECIES: 3'-5' exonuclease [Muribaculum]|jgi:DNA polymerase III epsilon chain|uniref:3'-5' exonuclease n=8 Tax=Muribaculum TaxID=1918540 RepID=A0A4P7VPN1_9BACT|nr:MULTISPECIES: 3'-5' exonuclease [Muribaculum]MCX4276398.1 3'-5' exonuclease [Muribaculum sp.]QCD35079.1 3'-5' exonuclease [Muribaculum gordoncarteri]TGY05573.1 3'-5' exonuclease [Muribaculum sp. NM65_B17]THG42912.1 3'-5' exonuclease [Muribaculaceae bacterium]
MELALKNPIIFFDLETTGTNILRDRIVEISYIKVMPSGNETERTLRINPGMPIPAEATAIHHITDDDVKNAPPFKQVAQELANVFLGCDIAGFNSNRFDVPMLMEEFLRAGVNIDLSRRKFVDVQTIFHKMEQRTLIAAYKFYCGKDLTEAHSANADTRATYEVLKAQLDHYPSLKNDIAFLSDFSSQNKNVDLMGRIIYNEAGKEVFNFGKYKGQLVEDVFRRDIGYYSWMMQGEFPANTKQVITNIKLRMK